MAPVSNWRERGSTNWFDLVDEEPPPAWVQAMQRQSQSPRPAWIEAALRKAQNSAGIDWGGIGAHLGSVAALPATGIWGLLAGGGRLIDGPTEGRFNGPTAFSEIANKIRPAAGSPIGTTVGQALNQPPSIADILAELQGLGDSSSYRTNRGLLEDQARAAVNAQYGPLIAALQQQKGSASQRAAEGQQHVGQLYNALSNDLLAELPAVEQVYTDGAATDAANYDDLEAGIKQQYAQSAQDQANLFNQLNIQAAATDVIPQQTTDQNFFQALGQKEEATVNAARGMESRGAQTFTRQGSQLARQEGANQQAAIGRDLRDLLSELDGQIAAQRGAQGQAYASMLGQLTQQDQSNAAQQSQNAFQNAIARLQLGMQLEAHQRDMQPQMNFPESTRSPADVSGRSMGLGLSPQSASNITSVFMQGMLDPKIQGGLDATTGTTMSNTAKVAILLEHGRQMGLTPEELNALQIMAAEYYGG